MAKNQIVLQSFLSAPHTLVFRDEKGQPIKAGKRGEFKTVRIPALISSPKNILILSEDDYEQVKSDPFLVDALERGQRGKGVRLLEDIPSGFWDPTQQLAKAEGEKRALQETLEEKDTKLSEAEKQIEELKAQIKAFGGKA